MAGTPQDKGPGTPIIDSSDEQPNCPEHPVGPPPAGSPVMKKPGAKSPGKTPGKNKTPVLKKPSATPSKAMKKTVKDQKKKTPEKPSEKKKKQAEEKKKLAAEKKKKKEEKKQEAKKADEEKKKVPKSLKRPAANKEKSGGGSKSCQPSWAVGVKSVEEKEEKEDKGEGEEEEPMEMDECVAPDVFESDVTRKDRSKDNKFKALLAAGSLPGWVVQAWKKTESMKVGRVAEQRKLVNSIFDRDNLGRLVVNLSKPVLEEIKDSCYQSAILHELVKYNNSLV